MKNSVPSNELTMSSRETEGESWNELVTMIDGKAVTTSLVIAKGTENEHASVIKLVRTYQSDLEEFGRVGFQIEPFETAGGTQQREVATLNEQQSTLLLTYMRNSDIVRQFKKKLVKAFFDLMQKSTIDPMQMLSDPATMRGLLLTYTDKVLALEHKVEVLEPKAEALDRIADAEGAMNPTIAAKALQVKPKKLFDYLREKRWIYRRPGGKGNVAYQDKIQSGYLTHKITTVQRDDGTEKVVEQVLVTAKGLAKLSLVFGAQQE
jgi:anti-repressor protein